MWTPLHPHSRAGVKSHGANAGRRVGGPAAELIKVSPQQRPDVKLKSALHCFVNDPGGWTPCRTEHIPPHVCSAEGAARCDGVKSDGEINPSQTVGEIQ